MNSNDNIATSIKAYLSTLVTRLLSFIQFFISDNKSYYSNDGYMPLVSNLTNCLKLLNFSSFMFCIKLFKSLIKNFPDVVNCRNSFGKKFPILYTTKFRVLVAGPIFNGLLCIFNNGR